MTTSIEALESPFPIVLLRVAVAGVLIVIVLVLVADEDHHPHVELAPPAAAYGQPPVAVASSGVPGPDLGPFRLD